MEDEEEDEEEEGDAGAVTTTSSFMEMDSTSSSDSLGVVKPGQLDKIVEDAEELVEAASAVEEATSSYRGQTDRDLLISHSFLVHFVSIFISNYVSCSFLFYQ